MKDVYNKVYSRKELHDLDYQLKDNEFIVEIAEDLYEIQYEGQYDLYFIYDEAEKKIKEYYQNKYENIGLSENEIKNKFSELSSQEILALQTALIERYNKDHDINVRLPKITDQIFEEITPSKVINMLYTLYGLYQLDLMDGEEKEYVHTPQDYVLVTDLYEMNKEVIDEYIANNDLENHFDNLLRKYQICKLLSEIII